MTTDRLVAAILDLHDATEARRIAARVDQIIAAMPGHFAAGARAAGRLVEWLGPDRLGDGRLAEAVKTPVLLAAATERLAQRRPVPMARPDPELDCVPSTEWPSRTTCDAVVIGSGAGGAIAARTLARAGRSVIVVEEGRRFPVASFRGRPPLERFLELYRGGGATFAVGRPPILLPVGRGVGGSTLVNSGTCYRPPGRVLERWRALGVDSDRLDFAEIERTLRVAPQPTDVIGRNGSLALAGADRLGWSAAPLSRNAPGCGGTGECATGCPRNAKYGVHLNALPQACAAGARIVTEATAERILTDHGRAAGLAARRPGGSRLEILAPLVVVAAGALHTPRLLRRSGLGRHPELGRNLAVHPAINLAGRFDDPVDSWSGVMQSVGIEELHNDGVLIEATAAPRGTMSFVLPGMGRNLRAELDSADRLGFLGAMIADSASGRTGRIIRYQLTRQDTDRLRRALIAMGRILFAAGARRILTGIARRPYASSITELGEIVRRTPAPELHVAAFHPTGTARMGADPRRAPVDQTGRLRGVTGVYVADAATLPTCPEVNPQISIMAMALSVAEQAISSPAPRRA